MENRKKTIWQVLICIGLLCVIWGGYFFAIHHGTDRMLKIVEDDFSWVYQFDSVEVDDNTVVLNGFAFELGKNATDGAFEIVLQDIESEKNYFLSLDFSSTGKH